MYEHNGLEGIGKVLKSIGKVAGKVVRGYAAIQTGGASELAYQSAKASLKGGTPVTYTGGTAPYIGNTLQNSYPLNTPLPPAQSWSNPNDITQQPWFWPALIGGGVLLLVMQRN